MLTLNSLIGKLQFHSLKKKYSCNSINPIEITSVCNVAMCIFCCFHLMKKKTKEELVLI